MIKHISIDQLLRDKLAFYEIDIKINNESLKESRSIDSLKRDYPFVEVVSTHTSDIEGDIFELSVKRYLKEKPVVDV